MAIVTPATMVKIHAAEKKERYHSQTGIKQPSNTNVPPTLPVIAEITTQPTVSKK